MEQTLNSIRLLRDSLAPVLAQTESESPSDRRNASNQATAAPILAALQKQVPLAALDHFIQRGLRPDPAHEPSTTQDLSDAFRGFEGASSSASVLCDKLERILERAVSLPSPCAEGQRIETETAEEEEGETSEGVSEFNPPPVTRSGGKLSSAERVLLMGALVDACRRESDVLTTMRGDLGPETTTDRLEAYESVLKLRPFFDSGMVLALKEGRVGAGVG